MQYIMMCVALLKNVVFTTEMQQKFKDSHYLDTGRLTVNGQVVALHKTQSIPTHV